MFNIRQEQITQNWGDNEFPFLSVICCTYNHESYIAQSLDGFLIQKTNFPFEVLVNDDASTDDTAKIIKEYEEKYPSIIRPFYHDVNEYSQGIDIFGNLVELAKGKYIAICEGDDYWIDKNKLQMQVDFLEKNPEYGMCYTRAKNYYQAKNEFGIKKFGESVKDFDDLLFNGNRIPTLTVCARKELIMQYIAEIKPQEKNWLMGDYPMWLYIAHNSRINFFSKITSVYRVLDESASHSKNLDKYVSFSKSFNDIQNFYCNNYGLPNINFDSHRVYSRYYSYIDVNRKRSLEELKLMNNITLKDRLKIFIYSNWLLFKLFQVYRSFLG